MTEPIDDGAVQQRAELLPEEEAVGSDDPQAQARAILTESQERVLRPEETRQASTQVPDWAGRPQRTDG